MKRIVFVVLFLLSFIPIMANAQSQGATCTAAQATAANSACNVNGCFVCTNNSGVYTWVAQSLYIGATAAACNAGNAGLFQYTSGALQYCSGSVWTTIALPATSPAAFSFTDQTGVSTSATITSNAVTLSGFSGSATATCGTGCTAIARNGTWGSTTYVGFVAGDTIAIKQTSSASVGTAATTNVTVGSTTSGTWTVTTTASTPSAFNFTDQTGVSAAITTSSNAVTLSGFSGSLTATCTGACTGIARNGVWGTTAVSGFVPSDTIALRLISAAGAGIATTAAATVGATTSSTWTVTTASACSVGIIAGGTCPDGSILAGTSPDGSVPMYTTPCDAGYYLSGGVCTACGTGLWAGSGSTCSTTYAATKYPTWNNGTLNWTVTGYTSQTTGKANTAGLIALVDAGSVYKAANYCGTLNAFGHADWYLPALNELNVLYTNRTAIGNFDVTDGSTSISGAYPGLYWSSSEYGNTLSYFQRFSDGNQLYYGAKLNLFSTRCVRR